MSSKNAIYTAVFLPLAVVLGVLPLAYTRVFSSAVSVSGKARVEKTRLVMGNVPCTVVLQAANAELAEKAASAAFSAVERVDNACDDFNPESELSRLNATAYARPFKCSPLLWDIITKCRRYHEISGGAFDITISPLMSLWGFRRKRGELPGEDETKRALESVGFDKLRFDSENKTVAFTVSGMKLDLGGMAKGYAVDLAAEAVLALGVRSGIINLAGNARCLPEPFPGKTKYRVGVENPFDKTSIVDILDVLDASVATSGDYERFVILDGKRYSHIIDPRTGHPASGEHSATVLTPSASDADALSTTVFVNGPEFAREFNNEHPETKFVFVSGKNQQRMKVERIGF